MLQEFPPTSRAEGRWAFMPALVPCFSLIRGTEGPNASMSLASRSRRTCQVCFDIFAPSDFDLWSSKTNQRDALQHRVHSDAFHTNVCPPEGALTKRDIHNNSLTTVLKKSIHTKSIRYPPPLRPITFLHAFELVSFPFLPSSASASTTLEHHLRGNKNYLRIKYVCILLPTPEVARRNLFDRMFRG